MNQWTSPDGKIKKVILVKGTGHNKPTESSECVINISDSNNEAINCKNKKVCVGDSDSEFERLLEITLQMMLHKEVAKVTFTTQDYFEFVIELSDFSSVGLIYEWDARFKYNLAFDHKTKGNNLFKSNKYVDASHRFSKGLKIICSIPLDVEEKPTIVDGLSINDINSLKAILYNNLASCYLKVKNYEHVINLADKVLAYERDNLKALYKMGVGCYEMRDFDRSLVCLQKVLKSDPENKAALHYRSLVLAGQREQNEKYNNIVKKMFQ